MGNRAVYEPRFDDRLGWVKFCIGCMEEHPVERFQGKLTENGPYYEPRCHIAKRRNGTKTTRPGFMQGRDYLLGYKYSMTSGDYERWLEAQNYSCAICGVHQEDLERSLAVDHDHAGGDIRGLLCASCNMGLGFFKDDPSRLEAARSYLLGQPSRLSIPVG